MPYETEWFRNLEKPEMLALKMLFWDEHRCAVEVNLSRISRRAGGPHPLTIEGSIPHVSLSTCIDRPWKDVGPWLHTV